MKAPILPSPRGNSAAASLLRRLPGLCNAPPVHPPEQSPDPRSWPGERIAGKYRVQGVIGQGGMGRVLAATNETTGKRVALKQLLEPSADAAARFAREARAAGRIHHPNVVDIYDVVEHEGATYLVMELLHGEPLSAVLARERRLSVAETVAIGIELARGVEAAHRDGVIHRDLKPANLFVCERSPVRVKILDFGISKLVEPGESAAATHSGVVLGTPHYMAPEQVRGTKDVDHRVDLYAMGAVLYAMLTGRPPHEHRHIPGLLVAIATVAPSPVELVRPDVPPALAEIVGRALAKEPSGRFETAGAMADALRAIAGGAAAAPAAPVAMHEVETLPTARAKLSAAKGPETGTPSASSAPPAERPPEVPLAGEALDTVDAPVGRTPKLLALVTLALAAFVALGAQVATRPAAEPSDAAPISPAASSAIEPAAFEPAAFEPAAIEPAAIEPAAIEVAPGSDDDALEIAARESAPERAPSVAGEPDGESEPIAHGRRRARSVGERSSAEPAPAEPEPPVGAAPSSSRAPRAGRIALDDF